MSEVELQPGWWFGTVRAKVSEVREYHAEHLAWPVARGRRPRVGPRPVPPRHLEWGWNLGKRPITLDQRRIMARGDRKWSEQFTAWVRRTPTERAPSPPRRGSVMAWGASAETRHYRVGERAREALLLLRRLAMAAGGVGCDQLLWSAEAYAEVRRPSRRSYGELVRDQHPLREARVRMEKAVKHLAAATAAGDVMAISRAESDRAEARGLLARADQEMARTRPWAESALAAFCLEAAERAAVQECAVRFVEQFGPLILDFGAWCSDAEYGAFVSRHPASAADVSSYLLQLGHERFLWPRQWREWASECYDRAALHSPIHRVPAPVGFYVWAAYMLTALRDHPERPGCQLFLANRLASLRLMRDADWFLELAEWTNPHQGRRLSARLHGELLDHLALAAAHRRSSATAKDPRPAQCEHCETAFVTSDGRRRYCDACSNRRIRHRVGQRRFRERHGS